MKKLHFLIGAGLFFCSTFSSFAQFNIGGQMVIRSEFRNGYGKLINEKEDPAGFIAHRARIQASYQIDRLNFFMSVQDVRTWGSTPTSNISDGFLSVHEAFAEISFGENWRLKLGRQELNYDNSRFLGNLDWALQARSHDFALMKYEKGTAKFHFGGGLGQDSQKLSGNIHTTPNQFKAAQLIRYENKLGKLNYSLLFWNDGRQFTIKDEFGVITDQGIRYMQTLGIPTLNYSFNKTILSGYFYSQFGKDVSGKSISGTNYSVQVTQVFSTNSEKGSKYRTTLGFESLSGTATNETTKNNSYAPLYGTNHIFNGLMDLFFVGNHFNSVGLRNIYLRTRYDFNPTLWLQADYHHFSSAATILSEGSTGSELSKGFGSEIDFNLGKVISESVSIQLGYSQYFATDTFKKIQNNGNLKGTQNWAYIMFVLRPNNKAKFIGVII